MKKGRRRRKDGAVKSYAQSRYHEVFQIIRARHRTIKKGKISTEDFKKLIESAKK